ncbi:DUF4150 domain-containing protein [Archangium violaceum]|uniref:DUF4150 domain-containing protein n=1 Tax=Archangium violaceum TaxID=83451 RepID=UPI00193C05CB|nr:DUF4150 domain-containing protein [Archangium violaceum]QRK12597.1 DUF4150 domain-containing protein [Archangium violaceum]
MPSVSVNAPKTPVTEDSNGLAAATLPNVCKMPGPPAPFVPTPLPNIGESGTDPKNYSKSVTIEGKKVAIRGATFGSMGDVASKGTGGGVVSANVEGPTSFVGPGSMDVKIEGKNVQLLGDPMLNNCGPSGSPANAATMMGVIQMNGTVTFVTGDDECPVCGKNHGKQGALKEIKATKVNAQRLTKQLTEKNYLANSEPPSTMLGVVRCLCKKKHYADRSSETDDVLRATIKDIGWHGPNGDSNKEPDAKDTAAPKKDEADTKKGGVLNFLKTRFENAPERVERIEEVWEDAEDLCQRRRRNKTLPSAYKPGRCAAPKTLLLVMQDGAHAGGITEQWFHNQGNPTVGLIKYHDRESGSPMVRQFAHGETVPLCESCNLILPLLLCPNDEERQKCQHKT